MQEYLEKRLRPLLQAGTTRAIDWDREPLPHERGYELPNAWTPAATLRASMHANVAKPTAHYPKRERKRTASPDANANANASSKRDRRSGSSNSSGSSDVEIIKVKVSARWFSVGLLKMRTNSELMRFSREKSTATILILGPNSDVFFLIF